LGLCSSCFWYWLLGAFPRWGYSRDWSYWPSGGLGLVLVIVVILAILGRI